MEWLIAGYNLEHGPAATAGFAEGDQLGHHPRTCPEAGGKNWRKNDQSGDTGSL